MRLEPLYRVRLGYSDGWSVALGRDSVTGYGRAYPVGRRQVVGTALHVSDDPRYRRLNDVVCPLVGEVRAVGEDDVEIVLDVAELVWEPLED